MTRTAVPAGCSGHYAPDSGQDAFRDLWLCGHHYRASLPALLASGAIAEELTSTADQAQADCAAAAA
jgi:hypothetical protein